MIQKKFIRNAKINELLLRHDYPNAARLLLHQQKEEWGLCASGYESLNSSEMREFVINGVKINVQFNPERIASTTAQTQEEPDKNTCFLCYENLPEDQKGILLNSFFIMLCNPYPIFPEHFTITHVEHIPQQISSSFSTFLQIAKELSQYYTIFYNGPKCGASVPGHLHFQAGNKFFMPLDSQFPELKTSKGKVLVSSGSTFISGIEDGLRRFVSIESSSEAEIIKYFEVIYEALMLLYNTEDEPMLNLHCMFKMGNGWRLLIFPREKHRPSNYFVEGDKKILLSPASVDMGGICILPRRNDFDKITEKDLQNIFDEVVIDRDKFELLITKIKLL